jgi:hypothetical protein
LAKGTSLEEIVDDPGAHRRLLIMLGFTIPAALLGGGLWAWQRQRRERIAAAAGEKGPPLREHVA